MNRYKHIDATDPTDIPASSPGHLRKINRRAEKDAIPTMTQNGNSGDISRILKLKYTFITYILYMYVD